MLALHLDRSAPEALTVQLARQVRERVLDGTLPAATRLPSTRALAADLGVARSVVEQAYAQLVAEGWLIGRRGAGTRVAPAGDLVPATAAVRPISATTRPSRVLLDTGTPWRDPQGEQMWRRAWREVALSAPPRGYPDHRGLPGLREALAERLARTRGLHGLTADEVRVCTGTTDGLRQLLPALGPGAVLVDDPGYRAAVVTARLAGRRVIDHPAGAPVATLAGVAAAYATPAHQHPTTTTMPGPERVALLQAARTASALVVEDDYDSEFRYDVAPIPAIAALDRDRVAYLGTASKSVAPSLRLGWLVAPDEQRGRIDAVRSVTHDGASWPAQRALLALLRDGYLDRAVRAARRVYGVRARRVAQALESAGATPAPIAGMYATIELPGPAAAAAHAAARRAGFDVPLLADYCRSAVRHGLVLGFGGCTDDELDRALEAITAALRRHLD